MNEERGKQKKEKGKREAKKGTSLPFCPFSLLF